MVKNQSSSPQTGRTMSRTPRKPDAISSIYCYYEGLSLVEGGVAGPETLGASSRARGRSSRRMAMNADEQIAWWGMSRVWRSSASDLLPDERGSRQQG